MLNLDEGKDTKINKRKMAPKQIAALICVALLVAMYVVTLIAAFLDVTGTERFFAACLAGTIGLPILFWIFIHFGSKKN